MSNIDAKDLQVVYNGEVQYYISYSLLLKQNCIENLKQIREAHEIKVILVEMMKQEKNVEAMIKLADTVQEIEFELQKLWKFKKDSNYHKFWLLPGCTCPKMDNEDRFPTGYYIKTFKCPIHGGH